jgi:group II intron reverse transcriptase/maturase
VESGKNWVVDIDLEKFFDRIHHDRLIHTLSKRVTDNRVLRLIGMTLRSGILQGEHYEPSTAGSPQGSPLSPLLSNIVLDELDKELESRGLSFCRYADDAKIYVGSQKSANRVMRSVSNFIESHLRLTVNRLKSKVAQTWDVVFLGFVITRKTIRISKKSMKRAFVKLKELIPRATHLSLEQQMKRFSQWYLGWANYYKLTRYPYQLQLLEAHARRRFRAQLISNTKRKRTLVRKLAARGVSLMQAKQAVYGKHRRRWRLSRTDAVHRAWGTAWFQTLKFPVLSTAKLPHWYSPRIRKAW